MCAGKLEPPSMNVKMRYCDFNSWCNGIADFYNNNPEFISGAFTGGFFDITEKHNLLKLFLGDFKKKNVLDIGCGYGGLYEIVAGLGINKYIGVDITPKALEVAIAKYPNAQFICGDFHRLSELFGKQKFEIVFILDTLEHSVDPLLVLTQCRQILTPDGKLMIIVPNYANFAGLKKQYKEKLGKYSPSTWSPFCKEKPQKYEDFITCFKIRRLLKRAGFKVLIERGWDIIVAFWPTAYGDNELRGFWANHATWYWHFNRKAMNALIFLTSKISMYYFVSARCDDL